MIGTHKRAGRCCCLLRCLLPGTCVFSFFCFFWRAFPFLWCGVLAQHFILSQHFAVCVLCAFNAFYLTPLGLGAGSHWRSRDPGPAFGNPRAGATEAEAGLKSDPNPTALIWRLSRAAGTCGAYQSNLTFQSNLSQ